MGKERKKPHWNIRVITQRTLVVFFSMLLLSDVGIANGRLEVKIAQQQSQSQQATRAAAKQAFDEGIKLYQQGTAESLRQAIAKWEIALKLYRQVDDKSWEAAALLFIGRVYNDLGEKHKALSYYDSALPLFRTVENKSGEAITLNNIGLVYSDLGEKHKALSYYNQALPLCRAVGDRGGEAVTLRNLALLERSKNNLLAALTHIEGAINIIEDLRTKIVSQDLRTSYFASVQGYYQFKIDLSRATAQKRPCTQIQCRSTP